MKRRPFSAALLLFVSAGIVTQPLHLSAQQDTEDNENTEAVAPDQPVPYDPIEFPAWSRDVRRGEIIALGAFPIAMILSGLSYQLGRFAYQSADAGEVRSEYAPWFFSTASGPRYNNEERIGLIVSAATISVGIAILDYALGRRERARE